MIYKPEVKISQHMNAQIKVGDIVKTKKGDQRMGVNRIVDGRAECVYQDSDYVPHTEVHDLSELILLPS